MMCKEKLPMVDDFGVDWIRYSDGRWGTGSSYRLKPIRVLRRVHFRSGMVKRMSP